MFVNSFGGVGPVTLSPPPQPANVAAPTNVQLISRLFIFPSPFCLLVYFTFRRLARIHLLRNRKKWSQGENRHAHGCNRAFHGLWPRTGYYVHTMAASREIGK
jgi:hypothetical protein